MQWAWTALQINFTKCVTGKNWLLFIVRPPCHLPLLYWDLTFDPHIPSARSEVASIKAWLECSTRACVILTHSSREGRSLCASVYVIMCLCVCVCLCARMTAWPALLWKRKSFWTGVCFLGWWGLRNVPVCVSTRPVCAFVASLLVCVLYLCPTLVPFTVIPVPPQQGWTYLQCHPQTCGQQGAPGLLQRLLSFLCSLVPRSAPLLWQV